MLHLAISVSVAEASFCNIIAAIDAVTTIPAKWMNFNLVIPMIYAMTIMSEWPADLVAISKFSALHLVGHNFSSLSADRIAMTRLSM
jgi:hypothetical protein